MAGGVPEIGRDERSDRVGFLSLGPVTRGGISLMMAFLIFLSGGCVTRQVIRPDEMDPAQERDIQIYTLGRRTIEFSGGFYSVVDSSGVMYLRGNGIEFRADSLVTRVPFSGAIPFADIGKIETRERNVLGPLYVTLFIGIFAVIGFGTNLSE